MVMGVAGKPVSAHVAAYQKAVGLVPDGLEIDHKCRNRACVNPDHLEAVTSAENMHRKPSNKLDRAKASEIRAMASRGALHEDIAARFSISRSMVTLIVLGQRWAA